MNYQLLSNELRFTARALLANQFGGKVLEQMLVSPQQLIQHKSILGIVVHAAVVFFGRQKVNLLLPFINILNNPAALNVNNYTQMDVLIFPPFHIYSIHTFQLCLKIN